jgi:hypothetical protein
VDDEWRVRLTGWGQPARGKQVSADVVCGLLRAHVGAEVSVGAGKAGIFLYAATAGAAATAAGIAREVFAQQGLAAGIAVERWDRSGQVWLPPGDVAAAELPSGQEHSPGRGRLRAVGALIAAIIDASGRGGLWRQGSVGHSIMRASASTHS